MSYSHCQTCLDKVLPLMTGGITGYTLFTSVEMDSSLTYVLIGGSSRETTMVANTGTTSAILLKLNPTTYSYEWGYEFVGQT